MRQWLFALFACGALRVPPMERKTIHWRLEDIVASAARVRELLGILWGELGQCMLQGTGEPWTVKVDTHLSAEDWGLVEKVLGERGLVVREHSDHHLVLSTLKDRHPAPLPQLPPRMTVIATPPPPPPRHPPPPLPATPSPTSVRDPDDDFRDQLALFATSEDI